MGNKMAAASFKKKDQSEDFRLPHAKEAEQALLGKILLYPRTIDEIIAKLEPVDFFIRRHGQIYHAMCEVCKTSEVVEIVAITGYLRREGTLNDVGGIAAI